MIRNEVFSQEGICIQADIYDLDNKIHTHEEMGNELYSRPMTDREWQTYGPQPLDANGALATLLVIQGLLDIQDAANSVGVTPEQLITEAQGWAAAAGGNE